MTKSLFNKTDVMQLVFLSSRLSVPIGCNNVSFLMPDFALVSHSYHSFWLVILLLFFFSSLKQNWSDLRSPRKYGWVLNPGLQRPAWSLTHSNWNARSSNHTTKRTLRGCTVGNNIETLQRIHKHTLVYTCTHTQGAQKPLPGLLGEELH